MRFVWLIIQLLCLIMFIVDEPNHQHICPLRENNIPNANTLTTCAHEITASVLTPTKIAAGEDKKTNHGQP